MSFSIDTTRQCHLFIPVVAEAILLVRGVVIVEPVVYFKESCGESPEQDGNV